MTSNPYSANHALSLTAALKGIGAIFALIVLGTLLFAIYATRRARMEDRETGVANLGRWKEVAELGMSGVTIPHRRPSKQETPWQAPITQPGFDGQEIPRVGVGHGQPPVLEKEMRPTMVARPERNGSLGRGNAPARHGSNGTRRPKLVKKVSDQSTGSQGTVSVRSEGKLGRENSRRSQKDIEGLVQRSSSGRTTGKMGHEVLLRSGNSARGKGQSRSHNHQDQRRGHSGRMALAGLEVKDCPGQAVTEEWEDNEMHLVSFPVSPLTRGVR